MAVSIVLFALCGFAGENLIKNHLFEEGSVNGAWSYSNGAGYSNPSWTCSPASRVGLGTADGTWVAVNRPIGKYAMYLQVANGSGPAEAHQEITVAEPGTYRLSFFYMGRPGHFGATTEVRLISESETVTLASVTTANDALRFYDSTVEIAAAGAYTFQLYQLEAASDWANAFDCIILAKLDDGDPDEYVVNGGFDDHGISAGTANGNAPYWSYSYPMGGFAIPGWNYFCSEAGGSGCGITTANGTWLAVGQTNGGYYSYFAQGQDIVLSQDLGEVPAGIYRFSFNCASRPSHGGSVMLVALTADGAPFFDFKTPLGIGTAFTMQGSAIAMPKAGTLDLSFTHQHDGADRAVVLDDISFHREAIPGWILTGETVTLSGVTEIPMRSFIDCDAEIASAATLEAEVTHTKPALTVNGTLTINGAITVKLTNGATLDEGDYRVLDARSLVFANGASVALDPANVLNRDTYFAVVEVSQTAVTVRIRNFDAAGNNYWRPASERMSDVYSVPANWTRNDIPQAGQGNIILNYGGTMIFDSAYDNATAKLPWYIRNGTEVPIVFEAIQPDRGMNFTGANFQIAGGNGQSGWLKLRSGTYTFPSLFVGGTDGTVEAKSRVDMEGATVSIADLQCGYGMDAVTQVNITDGTVTLTGDFNPNIRARTRHRFTQSGGTFSMRKFQAGVGNHCEFVGTMTGGDLTVQTGFQVIAGGCVGGRASFLFSGGTIHADDILLTGGAGATAEFRIDGGTLSPHTPTTAWLQGRALTVTAGKRVIADTAGLNATWCATLADSNGGTQFDFVKRGKGTLTVGAEQILSGALVIEEGTVMIPKETFVTASTEEGTVMIPKGSLAPASASVASGATLSLADDQPQVFTVPELTLAAGSLLAIDVTAEAGDIFDCETLDITDVTMQNPVVIAVNPIQLTELPVGKRYTVIASGVTAADLGKFLVTGVDAELTVENGALLMGNSVRGKVSIEWSGAAINGGTWSTGGNWKGDVAPQNGDTAVFNQPGGPTFFDLSGTALSAVLFGEGAAAFTHNGTDTLRITRSVTNLSFQVQTFNNPIILGVKGQDVVVHTMGDTILTGETVNASATLTKTGEGILAMPDTGLLSAGDVVVEEGTLRIDAHTGDASNKRAADGDTPYRLTVKEGARFDVNVSGGNGAFAAGEPSHGREIVVEGEGPDGAGALYNSDPTDNLWGAFFSKVTLTGDTKTGGGHLSIRKLAGSAYDTSEISGPYTLTVDNTKETQGFNFHGTAFDINRIDLTGRMQFEQPQTGVIPEGVNIYDNAYLRFWTTTLPETIPFSFEPNAAVTVEAGSAANNVYGPVSIGAGATVTVNAAADMIFRGAVTNAGTVVQTGNVKFYGPELEGGAYTAAGSHLWFGSAINSPESQILVGGENGVAIFGGEERTADRGLPVFGKVAATPIKEVRFMSTGDGLIDGDLYDELVANAANLYIDTFFADGTVTAKNATWNLRSGLYLGYFDRVGRLVIGEGSTVNVPGYLYISDRPQETYLEVAEGGQLNWTAGNNSFQIGRCWGDYAATYAQNNVVVSGGSIDASTGTVLLGISAAYAYLHLEDGLFAANRLEIRHRTDHVAKWRNAHDERLIQNGGVFALGSGGLYSSWPNWEHPHADLASGTFRAEDTLKTQFGYLSVAFGESPIGGGDYTIDLNGQSVTWNSPLLGASEVTLTGTGSFIGTSLMQAIPLGKWTVATGEDALVDLSGAAGFAGGLTLAPDTSVSINIGEGMIEYGMYNTTVFPDLNAAKGFTGTCPFIASSLEAVHTYFTDAGLKPSGNNVCFIFRGQFLVEEEKAGTWYFAGQYDDQISLDVDGVNVLTSSGYNNVGVGSATLTAGWHDFRIICWDATGSQGAYIDTWRRANMALGYSTNPLTAGSVNPEFYTRFDVDTIPMRLPQNAASRTGVRMRIMGAMGTSNVSTYNQEGLVYAANDCVTNTLAIFNNLVGYQPLCGTNARFDGYFLVDEANAGEWTFTGQYDDRIELAVDGTVLLSTEAYNAPRSGTVTLTAGWHTFRISVVDGSTAANGQYGGMMTDDDGVRCAIKALPAGGEKTLAFIGENFRIVYSVMDAQKGVASSGLGGVTTLGAGATLTNGSPFSQFRDVICPIYGTLAGGGALEGKFRFSGADSTWRVDGNGGRLTAVANIDAVANSDFLMGLAKIQAVFTGASPASPRYVLGPARDLTAADASAIAVIATGPDGEDLPEWSATVEGGMLTLIN
ncbi:MAG: hypothetical protein J6334_12670, partial [Kiritimatiellae bacterium]|nr:hypothetical protein [Kiritimatiellia bacterium]